MSENTDNGSKIDLGTAIDESTSTQSDNSSDDNDDIDGADLIPTLADYDEWEKQIGPEPMFYDCRYGGKTRWLDWATDEEQGRSLSRSFARMSIALGRHRLEQAIEERKNRGLDAKRLR